LLDQKNAPLFDALVGHAKGSVNLHIPAHRQGKAAPDILVQFAGKNIFKIDMTEIPGLDDLHNPQGVIADAQELVADLYGAERSFFLINGTSCGLQALLMSVCGHYDKVILPRNMHRSVMAGLIFSGADPVFIMPEIIPGFNFSAGFTKQNLKKILHEHSGAKSIMAVYPVFYGVGGDIKSIAEIAHEACCPLLVDEAHGAHLAFHPELPEQALALGVDASVQSTHKLGGSLTQSSVLHLKGGFLDFEKVADSLRLVQSTSPSYVLMASLDTARRQLALHGRELLQRALMLSAQTGSLLDEIPYIKVLSDRHLTAQQAGFDGASSNEISTRLPGAEVFDPTRLVINVAESGLSGYYIARLLAERYSVFIEMADALNLIVPVTIGTTEGDCLCLVQALRDIMQKELPHNMDKCVIVNYRAGGFCAALTELPQKAMTPREAWFAKTETTALVKAKNKISAEWVAVYPPGIPLLCPGEIISTDIIDYLRKVRELGLPTQGLADSSLSTVKTVL
jgi:arginine/lysine/ornithine decarboxylase